MIWSMFPAFVDGGQPAGGPPMEQERWKMTKMLFVAKSWELSQDILRTEDFFGPEITC